MYFSKLFFVLLITTVSNGEPIHPRVKGTPTVIGILTDPLLNRDSCGSSIFFSRALWVCRDTNPWNSTAPMVSNTASWTDLPIRGGGTSLDMYGDNNWRSFYPLVPGLCDGEDGRPGNQEGVCPDGTRFPHWQDSPPLVVSQENGTILAYTWMPNHQLKPGSLDTITTDPSTALYRVTYQDGTEGLPKAELVYASFWQYEDFPYGLYGGLIRNNFAYLWGQNSTKGVALARVPVEHIENKNHYEYFVGGEWTQTRPKVGDPSAAVENISAGGQGTYYWSDHWQSYVWIGQAAYSVSADFFITTAPEPEGPWIQPELFYRGQNGNSTLPAYTIQAHPGLSDPGVNEIYVSYTKVDDYPEMLAVYTTPLVRVEWEDL